MIRFIIKLLENKPKRVRYTNGQFARKVKVNWAGKQIGEFYL